MDTGLTTIDEKDIEKHRATAQSLVTRFVVLQADGGRSGTELAGTGRRFVSTVSTGALRRTREVELAKTIATIRQGDPMLSIPQHTLLFRARRGVAVALAVANVFARSTELESLQERNARSPLEGDAAQTYLLVPDGTNQEVRVLRRDTLDVISAFGQAGRWAGQFYGAHNIAADSTGNLYVTETYEGKRVQKFLYTGMGPAKAPWVQ